MSNRMWIASVTKSTVIAVILPATGAFLGFIWAWWLIDAFMAPSADFTETIELGERVEGKQSAARFSIKNNGYSPLEITDFQTNCGCTGVESLRDPDKPIQMTRVTIAPRTKETFQMRWNTRGPIGQRQRTVVEFRTNDPNRPAGRVDFLATVGGEIFAVPAHLNLGTAVVGRDKRITVEIRDRARHTRQPTRVESVNLPDSVRVQLIDAKFSTRPDDEKPELGKIIGVIEVHFSPSLVAPIAGSVRVHDGTVKEPIVEFGIFGESVAAIRLYPSVLVLPQNTSRGVRFRGNVLCRGSDDAPFTLETPTDISGVICHIAETRTARQSHHVEIDIQNPLDLPEEFTIPFRAVFAEGKSIELPLRIILRRPTPAVGG